MKINNHLQNLKKNGFLFIKFNQECKKFVEGINNTIQNYSKINKINFNKIDSKNLSEHNLILQNKINKKYNPLRFFRINKFFLKSLFQNNKFSIQSYFYLRMVLPKKKQKKYLPISLHREAFYGPRFYKYLNNIWIPIKNCKKNNAVKYIKNSHKFTRHNEFDFKIKKTNILKGSAENKIGLLYKHRILNFKKKYKNQRLFKNDKNFILFSGNLIHGNGNNLSNKIRISIDLRFMVTEHMKFNPVQGATKNKYFKLIKI